jgi:hypothetical protein
MYRLMQTMFDGDFEDDEFEDGLNTINGENFRKLMEVCFDVASYFSLTVAPWFACTETELEKELEPFLVKKIRVQKWFCYDFSGSDNFLDIHVYRAAPSTKNILLRYFSEVFLRKSENKSKEHATQTLEDLCVFYQNLLLLGTVTHEYICKVYPLNETLEQEILSLGRWKYIEDVTSEMIELEGVI